MDSEQKVQVRTGLFTLAVLIAAAVVVLFLTREGGLFTATYALYADFHNIQGLTQNAPVHLAGNHVGRVRSIYFLGRESERALRVELEIDSRVRDRIRTDSIAMIQTIGLLGDKYVALTLGSPDEQELPPGVPLETVEPINFEEMAEEGRELLSHLTSLSRSTEKVMVRFEEEMGAESLAATVGGLQRFVQEIEHGDGVLHRLVYDEAGAGALAELEGALAHLRSLLREVEEGDGTLHTLIYAPEGEIPTLEAWADATQRLDQILRKIDEGEGTLGALVNDPAVYEDLRLLMGGARRSALIRTLVDYVRPDDGN